MDRINQPSQTTRVTSAIVAGTDKIAAWKQKLSPVQIEHILRVVDAFGLSDLYDESLLPLRDSFGGRVSG